MVEEKAGMDAMTVLKQALNNVKPVLEVKSRRVGGSELPGSGRGAAGAAERPGDALVDHVPRRSAPIRRSTRSSPPRSSRRRGTEGGSVKKREDTHKMAEANKAFAHYQLVGLPIAARLRAADSVASCSTYLTIRLRASLGRPRASGPRSTALRGKQEVKKRSSHRRVKVGPEPTWARSAGIGCRHEPQHCGWSIGTSPHFRIERQVVPVVVIHP